jgi:hypothetical protein
MLRGAIAPALVLGLSWAASAADSTGLDQVGKPDLKSISSLAFGPKGVLFVADPQGAQIFAIGVGTAPSTPIGGDFKLEGVDAKIAALLGTTPDGIKIEDVAVEPGTNIAYVSVSRGKGPGAEPAIIRVDGKGALTALPLDKVQYAKVSISGAPAADAKDKKGNSMRSSVVTDLAWLDGKLFIAGLANEEFASKLRSVEFPFKGKDTSSSAEIFHTNHNRVETASPVRTFVPFNVGGQPHLLAAYTCTPLVAFPVSALKPGEKVHGKTVAELGNRNVPLDMIVYEKGGKQYLLLTNTARGVMKINTDTIEQQQALEQKVEGTAGLTYQTIESLKNVEQLDKLGNANALLLVKDGGLNLQSVALP